MIIKNFNYKDKDREVVVIYKSDTSLAGIDLNYLDEEEKKEVKEAFKDWEPKDFSEMTKLEEKREKKEWMRAYRRFNLDTSELFKESEENQL
jgi:hypothetical protein